ncbi:GFA family protein [Sandaracinobacteroides saxicola]|uniref:GFA family protein n=1 Tax=Sandaracinobacteroides saxicola TaxID=2759707 RepID=UPI00295E769E|nr:GFA family protein [Sandaracinobacteroides saxicola]
MRYRVAVAPQRVSFCHCEDCRRSAGAPVVAWAAFAEEELTVLQGRPVVHNSSGQTMRKFCGTCGTGLFYRNAEFLPGIVDVQLVTMDDAAAFAPEAHVQTAEQLPWMAEAHGLPMFERYPG